MAFPPTGTETTGNGRNASPSYRDQLAGQKADTRRRILASARKLFLSVGYIDANLNQVASGAGVGKGTLYRHFENKAELYVAMLSEHGETLNREMAAAIDPDAPTLKQVEQAARFYLDFWLQYPDHFQIVWAVQNQGLIGPLSAELTARLRSLFEAPLRQLEALVRKGIAAGEIRPVDPWNTANAIALSANAVMGQIVTGAVQIVERDMSAVYRQLQDLFLAGLAAAPEADPEGF